VSTPPEYDPWAWAFDRYWAHDLFIEPVEKLVLADVRPPARVLDLCCGSGRLAAHLIESGYRVTGLDVSGEMLAIASERAPGCRFVKGDARAFSFEEPFGLVLCTYDGLNHIIEPDELRRVFRCVRLALEPGAPFVFDLGTEWGFQTSWTEPHAAVEDDRVVLGMGEYDVGERLARYRITIFRDDGGWKRTDVSVNERCHRTDDVLDALAEEGFVDISRAAAEDLGMEESAERTFFRAHAP